MSARSIHPFPARMAPEIALDAIPDPTSSGAASVIDPMCGSGTVLAAAIKRGHSATGIDIDPLAVLMSQVATAPVSTEEILAEGATAVTRARSDGGEAPWHRGDRETANFVDFWFGSKQRDSLIALSSAIAQVSDDDVRAALQVAISRIIVTKSPQASLAADTSHSRPHRVIEDSDYDVFDGFSRSVRSLCRLLAARPATGGAVVSRGDSRRLAGIADQSMDLAITSPPYLNALDYMRGHKMALVWFGYSISELRRLRGSSIGAERALDAPPTGAVESLVDLIQAEAADSAKLPIGTIQRFAADMLGLSSALHRVLKVDAQAVLVVGNSTLRGNYIRNDLITQRAFEQTGFSLEKHTSREIPSTRRYMAIGTKSGSSTIANRMKSEVILHLRKSSHIVQ